MRKNKGISLIILVLIIVVILVIGGVSIFLITKNSDNSGNTNNQGSMNSENVENSENKNESVEDNTGLLTKSSLSLYNPDVKSSNYLSMIVYDPQKTRLSSGDKEILEDAIVVVTEFDKDIYSDFFKNYYKAIVNNNFVYRYSLGTDKKAVSSVICTNKIDDMSATIYDIELLGNDSEYDAKVTNSETINGSSFNKDYTNEFTIYADGWKATNYNEASSVIDLLIANTDTKNYYMSVNLTEKLSINNSNINKINQMVKNNNFENSVYFLKSSDDFSAVSKYYGQEIDLKNTVVYQDAIATQISNEFGLNVRDKDYFVHSDNTYIEYKAYGSDDYLIDIKFTGINKTMNYANTSSYYKDNTYSYTTDGIKYEYMADNTKGMIYVFKDTEYVGSIDVDYRGRSSTDSFKHLNELFGTIK